MKVKKCGSDADPDHVCANDGECVVVGTKDNGKPQWGCDCKGGTWAGQHCENAATQLCVISGDPIEAGEKGAFCTNGSTCVEFTEKRSPMPDVIVLLDGTAQSANTRMPSIPSLKRFRLLRPAIVSPSSLLVPAARVEECLAPPSSSLLL